MNKFILTVLAFAASAFMFAQEKTLERESPSTPAEKTATTRKKQSGKHMGNGKQQQNMPPRADAARKGGECMPPPPPHKLTKEEAQMLKTLFLMSNEELARLRQMISHLEKTPVEKRKEMAAGIERAMNATPEERQKMMEEARERFQKAQQNLLNRYYATLSEKDADAEREKFLKLDRAGKREYINVVREKLGLPTRPGKGHMSPPSPQDADKKGECPQKAPEGK